MWAPRLRATAPPPVGHRHRRGKARVGQPLLHRQPEGIGIQRQGLGALPQLQAHQSSPRAAGVNSRRRAKPWRSMAYSLPSKPGSFPPSASPQWETAGDCAPASRPDRPPRCTPAPARPGRIPARRPGSPPGRCGRPASAPVPWSPPPLCIVCIIPPQFSICKVEWFDRSPIPGYNRTDRKTGRSSPLCCLHHTNAISTPAPRWWR